MNINYKEIYVVLYFICSLAIWSAFSIGDLAVVLEQMLRVIYWTEYLKIIQFIIQQNRPSKHGVKNFPKKILNNYLYNSCKLFGQRVGYNILIWPSSLQLYFENSSNLSFEQKMRFEWARLITFSSAPDTLAAWKTKLAKVGFYYTGDKHICKCAFCGFVCENWTFESNPHDVHIRSRPDCPFIRNSSTCDNVPVHEFYRFPSFLLSPFSISLSIPMQSSVVTQHGYVSRHQTAENINDHIPQNQIATEQPLRYQQQLSQPAMERPASFPEPEQAIPSNSDIKEEIGPQFPNFAQVEARISTFQRWSGHQTHRALANAGFFYSGYSDRCTCFFCGGVLHNWEAGDDPWVEHARWFPKCAFLRKKKNEIFVEVIVGRQNETQASGAASEGSQQTITKSETQAKPQTISQTELSSLQAENSQLNNQFTCKVCLDKNISVAFLPCGHLACCLDCAPAMRKCPICRSNIKGTVRTYIR